LSVTAVTNEPRVYGPGSPNSFFLDAIDSVVRSDFGAVSRLERHFAEVTKEIERGSEEGRRALAERTSDLRGSMPSASRDEREREARAGTSSSMSGFTTPQYILKEFATYRGGQRAFADQCMDIPLPDVGLAVNIPDFSGNASAGVQPTEGTSIVDTDPTTGNLTEPIRTIAGQITASQQLIDRGANQGYTFDLFLYAQLRQNYDQSVDNYVLGKAIVNGRSIVEAAGSFSFASFYQDLADAREGLEDTAGNRLIPTHVFTTPDLYSFATRQVDDGHRPILIPTFAPGNPLWPDDDTVAWEQYTGTVLPGNLLWFVDENVPANGSNTQIVVSRPSTIVLMEGDVPTVRVFPETLAENLQAIVQLYNYVCCIPRYPSATATVTGAAYPTTLI
jgi:hypothetical protein